MRVVNDCWLKSVVTGLVQLQGWCSVVTLDLKNLDISWKAHGLAQALGQCSSLTKLHLRFQGLELFDKEFFELLGQGLGQCSFLADLNIECNCPSLGSIHFPAVVFARNLARFLVCVLRRCSASLTKLHLSSSSIESEGATCLAEVLGQCQSLKGLNLSMNQTWASEARSLSGVLGQCPQLAKLDLGSNRIGSEGATSLASVLGQCLSLAELNLQDNDVGSKGAQSLARVLKQCHSLTDLDLGSNGIGVEGAQSLGRVLGKCSALAWLGLAGNGFGAEGMRKLMDAEDCDSGMSLSSAPHSPRSIFEITSSGAMAPEASRGCLCSVSPSSGSISTAIKSRPKVHNTWRQCCFAALHSCRWLWETAIKSERRAPSVFQGCWHIARCSRCCPSGET